MQTDLAEHQYHQLYSNSGTYFATHANGPIAFLSLSEPAWNEFHLDEPYNPERKDIEGQLTYQSPLVL